MVAADRKIIMFGLPSAASFFGRYAMSAVGTFADVMCAMLLPPPATGEAGRLR
jgi:hypothetical protein